MREDRPAAAISVVPLSNMPAIAEASTAFSGPAKLAEDAADGAFDKIVIVAPPVALGVMRKEIGGKLAGLIVKEIAADYVKMPVPEIAKAVQKALEG